MNSNKLMDHRRADLIAPIADLAASVHAPINQATGSDRNLLLFISSLSSLKEHDAISAWPVILRAAKIRPFCLSF